MEKRVSLLDLVQEQMRRTHKLGNQVNRLVYIGRVPDAVLVQKDVDEQKNMLQSWYSQRFQEIDASMPTTGMMIVAHNIALHIVEGSFKLLKELILQLNQASLGSKFDDIPNATLRELREETEFKLSKRNSNSRYNINHNAKIPLSENNNEKINIIINNNNTNNNNNNSLHLLDARVLILTEDIPRRTFPQWYVTSLIIAKEENMSILSHEEAQLFRSDWYMNILKVGEIVTKSITAPNNNNNADMELIFRSLRNDYQDIFPTYGIILTLLNDKGLFTISEFAQLLKPIDLLMESELSYPAKRPLAHYGKYLKK